MTAKRFQLLSSFLLLAALLLAGYALLVAHRAEERAYRRIVGESWDMVQPIYTDFGFALPDHPPQTLREAMEPFFRAARVLEGNPK